MEPWRAKPSFEETPTLDSIEPRTTCAVSLPSASDLAPGDHLGPFRVERRLGEGARGVVYRAYDEKLKRPVALKLLPGAPSPGGRLLEEARRVAALVHPAIAAVYDVQQQDGVAFIVMELVEGTSLRARLEAGPIDRGSALRLAREIAGGLARAHAAGVVHRDLKPENVMITPEGRAKILDFGLARDAAGDAPSDRLGGDPNQTGVAGTPSYMAPEQARGQRVSARADVFSLGVVLYEMLTGERPFGRRGADPRTWGAEAWARTRLPRSPRLSPGLARVVERCLELEAGARFADGEEVDAALQAVAPPGGTRARSWGLVGVPVAALVVVVAFRAGATPGDGDPHAAKAPAQEAYQRGLDAWRRGDPGRARVSFREAVARDPAFAEGWLRVAGIERTFGDRAAAREALARIESPMTRLDAEGQLLFASYRALALADQCRTDAVCDGRGVTCPAGDPVPDGTPCEDENACTSEDVCVAGACAGRKRQLFSGYWVGTDGTGAANITQTGSHLDGAWVTVTRPTFVGTVAPTRQACAASVVFPDHDTYLATLSDDGCTLAWNNDTTWVRSTCPSPR